MLEWSAQSSAWQFVSSARAAECPTSTGDLLSDHALVTFSLCVKKPRLERLWTTCRPWKKFSQSAFEADLRASQLCTDVDALQDLSADELAELYDTTLQTLLDKHCPAVQTQRKFGPLTPWYDADCRASMKNQERWRDVTNELVPMSTDSHGSSS